jgi:branched-chain amino acid transport system ATP-binding protein
MTLLSIAHLSKSFDGVQAVDDVSFDLEAGRLLALIGPNGAGKSTCFNMINGQLRPSAGSIRFDGRDIAGMRPRDIWRLGVGRTFQIAATFNSMTVLENVQMALLSRERRIHSLFGRVASWKEDEAMALLDLVGMTAHARRSCAVAPQERNELMALTARLAKERNIGVLFTEHSMDVVFAHADKLIVLARGRLIAQGDAEAIRNDARVREVYLGTGASFAPCAALGAGASS